MINSLTHGFDGINQGEIMINIQEKDQKLHLHYQDNGHGITPQAIEQLFTPFYTTKANQGGTGLGTHIIQNLVTDTLDGTITVASEENQGLSYDIEFPEMAEANF